MTYTSYKLCFICVGVPVNDSNKGSVENTDNPMKHPRAMLFIPGVNCRCIHS